MKRVIYSMMIPCVISARLSFVLLKNVIKILIIKRSLLLRYVIVVGDSGAEGAVKRIRGS